MDFAKKCCVSGNRRAARFKPLNHRDHVTEYKTSWQQPERIMTTLTRTLLAAVVIGFIVGSVVDFTKLTTNPAWTVAMPLGTVFFGLFLISLMLQREMAAFDREEAMKLELVAQDTTAPARRQKPTANAKLAHLKEKAT
jgi:hypothetical protein